jgi:hypothetical protein
VVINSTEVAVEEGKDKKRMIYDAAQAALESPYLATVIDGSTDEQRILVSKI